MRKSKHLFDHGFPGIIAKSGWLFPAVFADEFHTFPVISAGAKTRTGIPVCQILVPGAFHNRDFYFPHILYLLLTFEMNLLPRHQSSSSIAERPSASSAQEDSYFAFFIAAPQEGQFLYGFSQDLPQEEQMYSSDRKRCVFWIQCAVFIDYPPLSFQRSG